MTKKDTKTQKQNFYFTIHSFMTHELGLRGSALIIYAIIYAFSQDGRGTFYGSRNFLAEYGGVSSSTVTTGIATLLKEGLIQTVRGKKHEIRHYTINKNKLTGITLAKKNEANGCDGEAFLSSEKTKVRLLKSINEGAKIKQQVAKFQQPGCQNLSTGVPKFSDYNKNNNKYNNKLIFNSYNDADAEKKEKNIFNFSDSGGAQTVNNEKENLLKPTYKHCNFDPEEAFRVALERTEELYREINEKE